MIILPARLREIDKPVIFFDGVCNFCNFWVQFIISRDPNGKFYFASLQSMVGQELLRAIHLPPHELDTMILLDKGEYFLKSAAAFHIAKRMGGFWRLGYIFMIVPKKGRDLFYDIIAKNRYRWFGKKGSCLVPSHEIKNRFLD